MSSRTNLCLVRAPCWALIYNSVQDALHQALANYFPRGHVCLPCALSEALCY